MNCGARRLCHQSCISPLITLETSADGAPVTGCFHSHGVPRAASRVPYSTPLAAHLRVSVVAAQFRRPMRLT
jgi:hypothetical protein